MLRLRVPEMTEQNSNCSGVAIAVDGYKFRYRYQIQIRMQIHMHVERRTEIQIQIQVHLYQTLFESQGIGTKYICRHIYINTFRFLDFHSRTRFKRLYENPHQFPSPIAPRLFCWDSIRSLHIIFTSM